MNECFNDTQDKKITSTIERQTKQFVKKKFDEQ